MGEMQDAQARRASWLVASRNVERALLGFAACAFALIVVSVSAGILFTGHWRGIDEWLLRALRTADVAEPIGSRVVQIGIRDLTALGGTYPLLLLIAIVAIYLLLKRHVRTAMAVVGSTLLGVIASQILKAAIGRGRPEIVPMLVPEVSGSFPSGHAMLSAIVYLTLGSMLARLEAERRVRQFLIGTAILLTVVIGFSRIYLGVHWPSDVLGGWMLGALWVVGVSRILSAAVRRSDEGS